MKNKKLENRKKTNSFKKLKSNLDKKIIKGCACYGVNKIHTCFCNPFVIINK
jgi:hypothetical protein